MFGGGMFAGNLFGAAYFHGGGSDADAGIVSTVWTSRGVPFANQALDYLIQVADDTVIASGTGTTDALGVLSIEVSANYIGLPVIVSVDNIGSDMGTAGRVWGKVKTVVS